VRFRFSLSALCAFAAMALIGCSGTLTSQHGYVLATYTADGLAALPSDDPLYEAFDRDVMADFDRDVMADPIVQHLLSLFDDTCGGFAATNLTSPNSQTLRNYLVVVTGGHSPGQPSWSCRGTAPSARATGPIPFGLDGPRTPRSPS